MIDTNAINARQASNALNQIEAWRATGAVLHMMSVPAYREASAGGDEVRAAKADRQLQGIAHYGGDEEPMWKAIERTIFPSGAGTQSQRNDVEIVFQARAWGYVLVTMDGASRRQPGGILGARERLAELGVTVMRPEEFVATTRERISAHHQRVRRNCALAGTPLPDWIDKD
ncbi:MAG: hypothetical protein HYX65_08845 [Gemmatimonadetes bacterium]|nr:hypothetical protein [Gemmatimonadota bacterium]